MAAQAFCGAVYGEGGMHGAVRGMSDWESSPDLTPQKWRKKKRMSAEEEENICYTRLRRR